MSCIFLVVLPTDNDVDTDRRAKSIFFQDMVGRFEPIQLELEDEAFNKIQQWRKSLHFGIFDFIDFWSQTLVSIHFLLSLPFFNLSISSSFYFSVSVMSIYLSLLSLPSYMVSCRVSVSVGSTRNPHRDRLPRTGDPHECCDF